MTPGDTATRRGNEAFEAARSPVSAPPRLLAVGVLISGQGTNLNAILSRCDDGSLDAEVRVAISNRVAAAGLDFGRERGVPTFVFPRGGYGDRRAQQLAMADCLEAHGVELVVLAGFDQILVPEFVARFAGRLINLHPSLLPAFPGGMHAVRDALAAGVKITGCTVHFVTDDLDGGPIIVQEAVPVAEDDDEESLLARVHAAEYRALPAAIQLFAERRLRIGDRRVRIVD